MQIFIAKCAQGRRELRMVSHMSLPRQTTKLLSDTRYEARTHNKTVISGKIWHVQIFIAKCAQGRRELRMVSHMSLPRQTTKLLSDMRYEEKTHNWP